MNFALDDASLWRTAAWADSSGVRILEAAFLHMWRPISERTLAAIFLWLNDAGDPMPLVETSTIEELSHRLFLSVLQDATHSSTWGFGKTAFRAFVTERHAQLAFQSYERRTFDTGLTRASAFCATCLLRLLQARQPLASDPPALAWTQAASFEHGSCAAHFDALFNRLGEIDIDAALQRRPASVTAPERVRAEQLVDFAEKIVAPATMVLARSAPAAVLVSGGAITLAAGTMTAHPPWFVPETSPPEVVVLTEVTANDLLDPPRLSATTATATPPENPLVKPASTPAGRPGETSAGPPSTAPGPATPWFPGGAPSAPAAPIPGIKATTFVPGGAPAAALNGAPGPGPAPFTPGGAPGPVGPGPAPAPAPVPGIFPATRTYQTFTISSSSLSILRGNPRTKSPCNVPGGYVVDVAAGVISGSFSTDPATRNGEVETALGAAIGACIP